MPSEVLQYSVLSVAIDLFSYAVLLIQLETRLFPNPAEKMERILPDHESDDGVERQREGGMERGGRGKEGKRRRKERGRRERERGRRERGRRGREKERGWRRDRRREGLHTCQPPSKKRKDYASKNSGFYVKSRDTQIVLVTEE